MAQRHGLVVVAAQKAAECNTPLPDSHRHYKVAVVAAVAEDIDRELFELQGQ